MRDRDGFDHGHGHLVANHDQNGHDRDRSDSRPLHEIVTILTHAHLYCKILKSAQPGANAGGYNGLELARFSFHLGVRTSEFCSANAHVSKWSRFPEVVANHDCLGHDRDHLGHDSRPNGHDRDPSHHDRA